MIVRRPGNWLNLLFVWHGSVLPDIVPQLLLMLLTSTLALLTDGRIFGVKLPLDTAAFPLVGISLAIFLGFRNSASYQRFTEARISWGQLLISSRALTSQAASYLPDASGFDRALFVRRLIGAIYALKHQLRGTDPLPELARYLPAAELDALRGQHFQPVALLDAVRRMLAQACRRQDGRSDVLMMLDRQLNGLAAAVGACERISHTPIPYAYGVLVHRTVYLYCLLLPFGLVDAIGVATPLITVFVSYTFFALEAIAQQIAEPFGTAPNCLALNAMTRNIERSLLEQCGEAVPPAQAADRYHRID
jgi:putative membrane protein